MKGAAFGILLLALGLGQCPASQAPRDVSTASNDSAKTALKLPRKDGSVRFGVIGDSGRGRREQYEVGAQMAAFHDAFPFEFVIMLGDNIYGADSPADMKLKFEEPYKALLDKGVKFYASLGNHDNPNQRFYKPFNMDGKRFYTFRGPSGPAKGEGSVRFFALDSNYLDKEQLDWVEKALAESDSEWKVAYFHHPLYSSGALHGSSLESRAVLEPLFVKNNVSVVFSGHDHFYERTKPQKGDITYFVSGAGGSLRTGNRASGMTAKEYDADYHFMIVEIAGNDLYYQAINRAGQTIDSGELHRPGAPAEAKPASPETKPVEVAVPKVGTPGRSTPEGPAPTPAPTPKPKPTPTTKPAAAKPTPRPSPKPTPTPS